MKKTLSTIALIAVILFGLSGCGNTLARSYGGTLTVDLPAGQKLQEATWKDSELWYLTRPMRDGEEPETWTLQEKTDYGVIEGKVIFKESK